MEREVMMQFLVEAMALSSFGGFIGIVLAGVATSGLSKVMSLPYSFDVRINIIAFVFSAAIGVIFGYVPAKRAARLDPIEALRHE
jgi:putative ABC transport system permease protein